MKLKEYRQRNHYRRIAMDYLKHQRFHKLLISYSRKKFSSNKRGELFVLKITLLKRNCLYKEIPREIHAKTLY